MRQRPTLGPAHSQRPPRAKLESLSPLDWGRKPESLGKPSDNHCATVLPLTEDLNHNITPKDIIKITMLNELLMGMNNSERSLSRFKMLGFCWWLEYANRSCYTDKANGLGCVIDILTMISQLLDWILTLAFTHWQRRSCSDVPTIYKYTITDCWPSAQSTVCPLPLECTNYFGKRHQMRLKQSSIKSDIVQTAQVHISCWLGKSNPLHSMSTPGHPSRPSGFQVFHDFMHSDVQHTDKLCVSSHVSQDYLLRVV